MKKGWRETTSSFSVGGEAVELLDRDCLKEK